MAVSLKMNSVTRILAAVLAAVSCFFIQTSSNQIPSALNSTFFVASERLFKPIYIPNIVNYSEDPKTSKFKVPEPQKTKAKEMILKSSLQSEEISKVREDYSDENTKTTTSPLKFSSRYSTKQKETSKERTSRSKETENIKEDEKKIGNSSRITETLNLLERNENATISSNRDDIPPTEKHKSFSDRSDELGDSEEELEESIEITPTTSEPYSELPKPTSFRKYSDEDFDNYETTSTEIEETDESEETKREDEEDESSLGDYYNSGSKNYHSIQTPLDEIKYRGHHSFKGDFKPETVRTRLVDPISRRPPSYKWPYSRSKIKDEFEKLNEISDEDESYEKLLDEGVKQEVKTGPKELGLEFAVEKDELKFDRNKKYNHIDERNRRKQQQKSLSVEEEKDDKVPLFQTLKQYQVNEKELNYQPINIKKEGIWPTKSTLATTPKNIFKIKTPPRKQSKSFNINELKQNFQNHRFLGPIVFNHNLEQQTIRADTRPFAKTQKQPIRSVFLKDLLENEKLDQSKLSNQRIQKSIFENGSKEILSFNHLEESEEMYNAILANIRSVFGVRIQSGKSNVNSQKDPEIKLDESNSFTWSLPLTKREKVSERM